MSKKDPPSKYLSSFYAKPTAQNQSNVPGKPQTAQPGTSSPRAPYHDADKFKNPADFFKSSQPQSSQSFSSQAKSSQFPKKTSFPGRTHDMLSQSFQPKKPTTGQVMASSKPAFIKPPSPSLMFPKPGSSFNKPFPAPQWKPHSVLDQNAASTKALELQWTTKMRQAKKAGMEARKLQGIGHQEKRNLVRSDTGKSPMGKSLWADESFTMTDAACKNQQNDPWYSNDVWGDDLSVEAVDECLRVACTQEAKKSVELLSDDTMSSWMNESWASPEKFHTPPLHTKSTSLSVRTALFTDKKGGSKEKGDDFMALLSGDPAFMSFLDSVESQQKPSIELGRKQQGSSFSPQARSASSQVNLRTPIKRTTHPSTQLRRSVPLSERLPVSIASGSRSSFVIKAKEFESPSKNEGLSLSQRKLQKPTKSLPSPTPTINKHQTEWLRGQLEKITTEFSTLKEDVQLKEGESKLLREKLKTVEEEVKKHKLEKAKELETLREAFEKKVKQLERELEATHVQAIFKAKEAESSLEKYRELKTVSVRTPEPPVVSHSFKNLPVVGSRPGESSKTLFVDETASTNEIIDDTMDILLTPSKKDGLMAMIEGTPEKCMFDDSPVGSPAETKTGGFIEETSICDKETESAEVQVSVSATGDFVFNETFLEKNSVFAKVADKIVHGAQPKRELNHFLMPPMEYLHHALLQTEFSEQEFENYPVRRPTLVELWGTSYDAFGDTILNDYEKAKVGDLIPDDPARSILAKSRYFTSLRDVHGVLTTLSRKSRWGPPERNMAKSIVDLATDMTRELYATLGDPRFLQTTYTIYDRDPKILKDFQNSSELRDSFDPLSPERWKNESYVELRRCLVFVGFLCSLDHKTTRYIVNPKARKSGKTADFYPPNVETNQNMSQKSKTDEVALKIILKEGERKPSELKLMNMYRDLHSKKLTVVSELVSTFVPKERKIRQPSKPKASQVKDLAIINASSSADDALIAALEQVKQIVEFRTDFSPNYQLQDKFETLPSFEEYQNCLGKLDLALDTTDVEDMVSKIQGELNPKRIHFLKQLTEKPKLDSESDVVLHSRDLVKIPENIVEAVNSDVARFNLDDGGEGFFSAPTNRCITDLEKQMMNVALNNINELRVHVRKSIDSDAPCELDVTRYVCSSPDVDMEKSRKRKMSVEEPSSSKVMKVTGYQTPPFDKTLYSQIQKHEPEEDEAIIISETQTQLLPDEEDDQVAKFEKREEIAELKRKMLAEEKELETKHHPLTSRHSLAPSRLTGRHSPSCEESADKEMVMEIEKMFQSQVKPDVLEESVWSSSESDGEDEDRLRSLSVGEDDVEIEFIPDLVKNFHHKLKNAGLLELLCEIFKEGGILRFTHRLNGVMLGTVLMLQKIVMFQKKEVEPYCSKMATIIREILYARPSPRIVLEVNVLLRYAVGVQGFTKMLCHNASPDTFVISPEKVYFMRGACLLETICIIVTYTTDEDTDLQIYFEISSWVYRIICCQKKHMTLLYEQHNTNRRRCMCITALNNTMVMLYHRALSLYRSQYETHTVDIHKRKILEKIFIGGLQVLRLVYSYSPLSFLYTIRSQYNEYRQLLVWLKTMHEDTVFYQSFELTVSDLFIVTELLKTSKNPNPDPGNSSDPTCLPFFGVSRRQPYDLDNSDSLIKSDTSESEDD